MDPSHIASASEIGTAVVEGFYTLAPSVFLTFGALVSLILGGVVIAFAIRILRSGL